MSEQTRNWNDQAKRTIFFFLFATLADAEGALMNGQVPENYAKAAFTLMKRAKALGLCKLPEPASRNVQA